MIYLIKYKCNKGTSHIDELFNNVDVPFFIETTLTTLHPDFNTCNYDTVKHLYRHISI